MMNFRAKMQQGIQDHKDERDQDVFKESFLTGLVAGLCAIQEFVNDNVVTEDSLKDFINDWYNQVDGEFELLSGTDLEGFVRNPDTRKLYNRETYSPTISDGVLKDEIQFLSDDLVALGDRLYRKDAYVYACGIDRGAELLAKHIALTKPSSIIEVVKNMMEFLDELAKSLKELKDEVQ